MSIDAATATVIAAVVGAGVGGFVTLLGQWLTQRSQERQHLRQLIIQTAMENWRFTSDAAEKLAASGHRVNRYPLDSFILHMLKLSEILNERRITPKLVREKLEELHAVTDAASETIRKHSEARKASREKTSDLD
jgi:hypothetical protein